MMLHVLAGRDGPVGVTESARKGGVVNERSLSVVEIGALRPPGDDYDVVVLGGGLAGLTVAIQIKQRRPRRSVLVLEKREGPAPLAAFKVGESTVPAGAQLLRECDRDGRTPRVRSSNVKCGLRFFPPAAGNADITKRVELGPTVYPPFEDVSGRSWPVREQARGACPRDGRRRDREGARVQEIELGDSAHGRVRFVRASTRRRPHGGSSTRLRASFA